MFALWKATRGRATYTYTLDALGNRTRVDDLAGTTVSTSNEVAWLTNETAPDGTTIAYQYEGANGNRVLEVAATGTPSPPYWAMMWRPGWGHRARSAR